jgi:hypothetical protein
MAFLASARIFRWLMKHGLSVLPRGSANLGVLALALLIGTGPVGASSTKKFTFIWMNAWASPDPRGPFDTPTLGFSGQIVNPACYQDAVSDGEAWGDDGFWEYLSVTTYLESYDFYGSATDYYAPMRPETINYQVDVWGYSCEWGEIDGSAAASISPEPLYADWIENQYKYYTDPSPCSGSPCTGYERQIGYVIWSQWPSVQNTSTTYVGENIAVTSETCSHPSPGFGGGYYTGFVTDRLSWCNYSTHECCSGGDPCEIGIDQEITLDGWPVYENGLSLHCTYALWNGS